jgi:hypothetical protein
MSPDGRSRSESIRLLLLAVVEAVISGPGVARPAGASPRVGEHNDALLAEARRSDAQIAKQREREVISPV